MLNGNAFFIGNIHWNNFVIIFVSLDMCKGFSNGKLDGASFAYFGKVYKRFVNVMEC